MLGSAFYTGVYYSSVVSERGRVPQEHAGKVSDSAWHGNGFSSNALSECNLLEGHIKINLVCINLVVGKGGRGGGCLSREKNVSRHSGGEIGWDV